MFENLEKEELASLLRRFYAEIRKKNGDLYSRSGLINVRASIQRHLAAPPYNVTYSIQKDREFLSANQVIQAQVKQLRKLGKDETKHKDLIEEEDMAKIKGKMDTNTATGLQQKVFLDILTHFARRGQEGLRELTKTSIIICKDSTGKKFATMAYTELEKNHNGLDMKEKKAKKIMYEVEGDADCPVKSLEKYLSKLHPKCSAFFQRPQTNVREDDPVWYANAPVGKNKLGGMIKQMSKAAGCSQVYTNHCVRATVCTELNRSGIPDRDICSVTGHKRVESLQSYINTPSTVQRQHMSNILHRYGKKSEDEENCPPEPNEINMAVTVPQNEAVTVPQNEAALPTQTLTLNNALQSLMHGNTFNGIVNIYINNN